MIAEVISSRGGEVHRGTPLQDGRATARRVQDFSAETQPAVSESQQGHLKDNVKSSNESDLIKQSKTIDIHNLEVSVGAWRF